jgi:hypothetical protein
MILSRLVRPVHVLRHLLGEVLVESRVPTECVDYFLASFALKLLPRDGADDFVAEGVPGEGWGSHDNEGGKKQAVRYRLTHKHGIPNGLFSQYARRLAREPETTP